MDPFLLEKKLAVTYRSQEDIEAAIRNHAHDEDKKELWLAYMDLWNSSGAAGVPQSKVKEQKQKYFSDLTFRTIEEFIDQAKLTKEVL
jgi:hypothetical protein